VEFRDVVRKRRMVRAYAQRPVPPELVDRLLDVARRGPTAGFAQGIDFVVLDTPSTVARFWELTEDPDFPNDPGDVAVGPPVIVLAFSDPERYLARYSEPDKIAFGLDQADTWPVPFWDTDTAMACMLLLLAAVDEGLGALFFGQFEHEAAVKAALGIPADRRPVGTIALGYARPDDDRPSLSAQRPRRPLDDVVHRGRW
jgi:nitroreductase